VRVVTTPNSTAFHSVAPTQPSIERPTFKKSASADQKVSTVKETLADEQKMQYLASEEFKKMDKDGNGTLSLDELVEGMSAMNKDLGIGAFRDRDAAHYIRRFDTNSDGILSEDEFYKVYRYLLLAQLNEEEPMPFCRDMFVGRRSGQPADHYEILETLGQGSFGIVKKVLCKTSRAPRVLKSVDKNAAMKSGMHPQMVMEEIDKLKALDHPAVLRLFEYYADTNALHLITDHLPGGELAKIVEESHKKGTPLAEAWVRKTFHQVCEGIAYCHGKGVMHRDLKLENVMLGTMDPPEAIIIDVGLAELFPPAHGDNHRSSKGTGSIQTMAPEVFRHSSTYKCDVWSLGCCLFGMVCKKPLWIPSRSGGMEIYPYPFAPPQDMSQPQLQQYIRRQQGGPDLMNTWCSPCTAQRFGARQLIHTMLTFNEQARPNMRNVLPHPWLRGAADASPKATFGPEQLDCLVNFQRSSALDEVVLLNVASQLPLSELAEFRELFRDLDVDGNGRLDASELVAAMQRAGLEADVAKETAEKFARAGSVEFSRFVAALVPSRPELLMPYLCDAFNRLDTDGDGYITADELRDLLATTSLKQTASQAVENLLGALGGEEQRVTLETLTKHVSELCA